MSFYNLKKPEYKGKRFVVIDDSTAIKLAPVKKNIPVITASVLTVIGVPVIYFLLKNESGVSPDLFAAFLFCIIVAWMWTQILNTIVEISIKENKIFFTDYLSNLKYMFIPDIIRIEEKKSKITIFAKSEKISLNPGFEGINEFIEQLIKINPQIEKEVLVMLNNIAEELKITVLEVSEKLSKINDSESKVKPAPGKWSKIEILGHLIDSASNNHQRFVRAQLKETTGPSYMQDYWVNIQAYNERDWREIIELWLYYNLHLSEIIKRIPEDNLKTMWTIADHEPMSVGFIAEDYLRHLKHHVGQLGIL